MSGITPSEIKIEKQYLMLPPPAQDCDIENRLDVIFVCLYGKVLKNTYNMINIIWKNDNTQKYILVNAADKIHITTRKLAQENTNDMYITTCTYTYTYEHVYVWYWKQYPDNNLGASGK